MGKLGSESSNRMSIDDKLPQKRSNPRMSKDPIKRERIATQLAAKFTDTPKTLALNIIRTDGNDLAVDALAKIVGGPKMTSSQLNARILTNSSQCLKDLDLVALSWYAIALAAKRTNHEPDIALRILRELFSSRSSRPRELDRAHLVFLQLLGLDRDREGLLEALESSNAPYREKLTLELDANNPFLYPDLSLSLDRFQKSLSTLMDPARVGEIGFDTKSCDPFYRLESKNDIKVHSPAKITVITSSYGKAPGLVHAARSIVAQTWKNWEMLIVDDASTDAGSVDNLKQAQALDPRIRVIQKAVNGGTYLARNTAMMQSRGEYVTFLDSDDWAHPRWLEDSIAPLLYDPNIPATIANGLRVSEQLETIRLLRKSVQISATTLMFRKHEMLSRIGFFDANRKAADSEYAARIEKAFGRKILKLSDGIKHLMLIGESLSSDEFGPGWHHQVRWLSRDARRRRLEQMASGKQAFYISAVNGAPLFSGQHWRKPGDRDYKAQDYFDVVFVSDWRQKAYRDTSLPKELDASLDKQRRIGILQISSLRRSDAKRQPLNDLIMDLLENKRVEFVHHDSAATAHATVILDPEVLQFSPRTRLGLKTNVLLIKDPDHADLENDPLGYSKEDVHIHASEIFGSEPCWIGDDDAHLETTISHAAADTASKATECIATGGSVRVSRPNPWDEAKILAVTGKISAVAIRTRRPADATLCDSLVVVFSGAPSEDRFKQAKAIASNLSRGEKLVQGNVMPTGVIAMALSIDESWSFNLQDGWLANENDDGTVTITTK